MTFTSRLLGAICALIAFVSLSATAETVKYSGTISWVNLFSSSGIFYPAVVGDNFTGAIDDVTGSGFISNGITTVTLSCCSLRPENVPYEVFNDEMLSAVDAIFFNAVIGAPVFSTGDIIDMVSLEGRASTPDGGILAASLTYVFDSSAFDDASLNNYPFTTAPLYTLFGIWEESLDNVARFDVTGTVNPVPVPAAVWLFGSGLISLIGLARRKT